MNADIPPPDADSDLYRALFSAYPDALLVVDRQGRIVRANPSAATLLGYSIEELLRLSVEALVPDAVRPQHADYRNDFAKHPRQRPMGAQMDLVAKRKDGSEKRVEIALSPLQDQGIPLTIAAIRDIGEYPRVKQALRRAHYSERLAGIGRLAVDSRDPQALLDQVPGVVAEALEVDCAAVYVLETGGANLRVASAHGSVPGEAVGCLLPFRPDTSIGFVFTHGVSLVCTDYATEHRFVVPREYLVSGLRSAAAAAISDRGRINGVLAVRSRTPRSFGDDEVRFLESVANLLGSHFQRVHSEEALGHAQRLESVGQLTGGIAHDFNNLLTVIQGNLQVLEELPAIAADDNARQMVGAAAHASKRGAELTTKLLAFSRRQVLQPEPLRVQWLLESLADMLRRTLDQRIRIEVDVAEDCPPVLADVGQLEAALLNVAINARDAMPDGGLLRFTASPATSLVDDVAGDEKRKSGRYVEIAVSDNGTGMTEEVRERAFEPFFTTKEAGRGTGLGLSTVYGFARQSRGTVRLESAPGRGTTLTLVIPDAASTMADRRGVDTATSVLPSGLKLLLVEDDPDVRDVFVRHLRKLGCVLDVAENGERALAFLEGDAVYDVLLSDIALGPGMRGPQLAARVHKLRPDIGVLLMSGFPEELLEADEEAPASWELLQKPCSREELAAALARVVASRLGASPG